MRNNWMLAAANLRKSKGNAVSLALVMLFVAMFINIAFVMLFGITDFFNQRADELNTGHVITYLSHDEAFANAQLQFISQDARISTIEVQDFVSGDGSVFLDDDLHGSHGLMMFSPIYDNQQLNPLTMVGDYLPLTSDAIYIPYFILLEGGFELGDTIRFLFMEEEISFTIAGSIEEIMFGAINGWRRRMYVSSDMFYSLQQQFTGHKSTAVIARLYDSERIGSFVNDYLDYLINLQPVPDSLRVMGSTHNFVSARNSHMLMPTLIGTILSVFAIVFLIVSLIVMRFRINNSIDEGMTNIGTLKALGYTNRQIVLSILLQFGLVALIGGAMGMLASQLVLPSFTTIMGPMFSFVWRPDVNIPVMLVMLAFILTCVLLFSLLSTMRIYRLYPLVALRGEFASRKGKIARLPLDKVGGSLPFLLAVKDVLQNKRQTIAIGFIVLGVTFTAVIGIGAYYATAVNYDEFLKTMVGEPFDILAVVNDVNEAEAFADRMRNHPNVDRITGYVTGVRLALEDTMIFAEVAEDSTQLVGNMLVTGRYPIYYNEIALAMPVLRATGTSIGDVVNVRSGGESFEFVIVGQMQSVDGMIGNIAGDGLRRMQPFEFDTFAIFLADGICNIEFAEVIRETESELVTQMIIFDEIAESFINSMSGIFAALSVVILAVTAVIVAATMYLVIKTAILRKRRELGIQKALGFTTFQLMNQVSLNLTPAIVLGALVGAVAAFNLFDLFFVIVTGVAGDISVSIPMPLNWTIMAGVGVVVLAYVVSMAVALRIRKISAYALVSE